MYLSILKLYKKCCNILGCEPSTNKEHSSYHQHLEEKVLEVDA